MKQNEISKPKVTMQSAVNRTVSAGYEVTTDQMENFIKESKEKNKENQKEIELTDSSKKMKLNVNASMYIPKNKLTVPKTTETTTTTEPLKATIQPPSQKSNIQPNPQFNMINPQLMMMNNPAYYNRNFNFNFSENAWIHDAFHWI